MAALAATIAELTFKWPLAGIKVKRHIIISLPIDELYILRHQLQISLKQQKAPAQMRGLYLSSEQRSSTQPLRPSTTLQAPHNSVATIILYYILGIKNSFLITGKIFIFSFLLLPVPLSHLTLCPLSRKRLSRAPSHRRNKKSPQGPKQYIISQ